MDIWKILWLFVVVITTLAVIAIYGPGLGSAIDAALRQDASYTAGEIAGVISLVGAGPDGVQHAYALPKMDRANCVRIYRTYVSVDMRGSATADIVEGGAPVNVTALEGADAAKGDRAAGSEWSSLNVTCSRREAKNLMIMRKSGQVMFGVTYGQPA